jgi:methionyl-tRNA formyltransferase
MKPIVQDGEPVLRTLASEVPSKLFNTPELREMLKDMEEALDAEVDGVALAAPQIALPYRIFIVRYDRMEGPPQDGSTQAPEVGIFINPVLQKTSKKKVELDEGCLSVRGYYGKTDRHERATVEAYDERGVRFTRGAGGILAQAFQHELDHLNGVLFIDHAHNVKKYETREHMPFVFFGTPIVASRTLELLKRRGYMPSLIVTSKDARSGRGLALKPSPVKEWGERHGIPVIAPEKLTKDVCDTIGKHEPAYGIVVAYGKLLPKSLITAFPKGVLNIHYSLLPKYRGASPVETALLHGETETGVTIQQMVEKLDAGDILAQKKIDIDPSETTRELRGRLIRLGGFLLADILPLFEGGTLSPTPQNEQEATYAGKIEKKDGELSLPGNDKENWNKYRAYAESPGTYFFAERNGKKVRVKIQTATYEGGRFIPERIVPEGKKEMDYKDFLRG